jgi:hypothetical protein
MSCPSSISWGWKLVMRSRPRRESSVTAHSLNEHSDRRGRRGSGVARLFVNSSEERIHEGRNVWLRQPTGLVRDADSVIAV